MHLATRPCPCLEFINKGILGWAPPFLHPTSIASVHLVMGCPNSRAGEKKPLEQLKQPQISTPSPIASSGVAAGVALVVPMLAGQLLALDLARRVVQTRSWYLVATFCAHSSLSWNSGIKLFVGESREIAFSPFLSSSRGKLFLPPPPPPPPPPPLWSSPLIHLQTSYVKLGEGRGGRKERGKGKRGGGGKKKTVFLNIDQSMGGF